MVFTPQVKPQNIHRIEKFRGLNLNVDPTALQYNESPFMQNMRLDLDGIPSKRSGYKKALNAAVEAPINGLFSYRKTDGTLVRIVHGGTKLYTWTSAGAATQIYASMNNAKSSAFTMNGIFYIFDQANYLQYDGTTVSTVSPYVPATRISAKPDGTNGVANEAANLIGGQFENWFTGDGTSTVYNLNQTNLDATAVVASTDFGANYNKVEGTDFTVDRTVGTVTWSTAPALTTDANNVRIRASKTGSGNSDKILKGSGVHLFGGANDTKAWRWNGHFLYRSGTLQPNYWPATGFQAIGDESEDIKGMATQYGNAVIYKDYSIWLMQVSDDGVNPIKYPTQPLNDAVGCQAPFSLQIINNSPVALTDTGVYELMGSNVRDERNVSPQSKRVNAWLLAEANIEDAVAVDTGTMYILCLNGNAYVWHYELPQQDPTQSGEWYFWTNIPAVCFYTEGTDVFFGDANGMIFRFTTPADLNDQFSDDGAAISAIWRSKIEYLGTPERLKTISRIWITIQPYSHTSADIYYYDQDDVLTPIDSMSKSRFSYSTFSYVNFTYITSRLPQTDMFKAKVKKVQTFQLEIRNENNQEQLGILGTQWEFEYKSKFK